MARGTAVSAKPAFAFSKDAVQELQDILGDSAQSIVRQLETLSDSHWRFLTRYHGHGRQKPAPTLGRDIKRIATALETLVKCIDEVRPHTKAFLEKRGALYDLTFSNSAWDDLGALRESARRTLSRLAPWARPYQAPKRPRGRPVAPDRRSLAYDVALILRANGIPVASTPDRQFDSVMRTLLDQVEGKSPENLFRLLKPAAAAVEELSNQECRSLARNALRRSQASIF
jgi:hypothetical protein